MDIVSITVKGDSGHNYLITTHPGNVLFCSCPAWKNQKKTQAERTCKHIKYAAARLNKKVRESG